MNILQINASARREGAYSTRLADLIVTRLRIMYPTAAVTIRDLATHPHPVLDEAAFIALSTPIEQRTPEQINRVVLDDRLIAELQAADVLVLGVPMYNFNISVQLKTWIDAVTRAGVTFRYTDHGPKGLLYGKRAYVGLARGGRYRGTAEDFQTPYLKRMLGFIGITDVHFIYAEGLNMGPDGVQRGFAEAEADLAAVLAREVGQIQPIS